MSRDNPGESEETKGNRAGLLILVAIPLIPVGYGIGALIVEALRDWLG